MSAELTAPVPAWSADGIIPAVKEENPTSHLRSPYIVTAFDLALRFGITKTRRDLLKGLLDFRSELHRAGLIRGFQWINGSFVENVEVVSERSPNDIDLVTFFYIPDGHTASTLLRDFPHLFDHDTNKVTFSVDAYFQPLDQLPTEEVVNSALYWYSVWSHTRGGRWKGYLQLDLSGDEDEAAKTEIERMDSEEGDGP